MSNISLAIGLDMDPHYLMNARINASINAVAKKIDLICGDLTCLRKLKIDVIFIQPLKESNQQSLLDKAKNYLISSLQIC